MGEYNFLLLVILIAGLHIGIMARSNSTGSQCVSRAGTRSMDMRCQMLCQSGPCPMFCICKSNKATDNCSELTFAPNNIMKINETVTPGTTIFSIDVSGQEEWSYTLARGGSVDGSVWSHLSSYLKLRKIGNQYEMIVNVTPDLEDIYQLYGVKLTVLILSLTCKRRGLPNEPNEIFLEIVPVNEYPPEFLGTPLSTTVPEDTPLEAEIYRLSDQTLDMDVNPSTNELGAFEMWEYLPDVRRDGRAYFEMRDIQKGTILLQKHLNFEALQPVNVTQFFLNLSASDVHGSTSYTTLTVNIQDVDDLPPEFYHPGCPLVVTKSKPCLVSYEAHLPLSFKGQITNMVPGLIRAKDMDSLNYPISYSLEQGPGETLETVKKFSINETTGAVFVNTPIDQKAHILLVIVATEVSQAARATQASLNIKVDNKSNIGMLVFKPDEGEGNDENNNNDDITKTTPVFLIVSIVLSLLLLILVITVILLFIKLKKQKDARVHPSTNNNRNLNSSHAPVAKEDKHEISRESSCDNTDLSLPFHPIGNRNQQNSSVNQMPSMKDGNATKNIKTQTLKEGSNIHMKSSDPHKRLSEGKERVRRKSGVSVSKEGRTNMVNSDPLQTSKQDIMLNNRAPLSIQSKDSIYSDDANNGDAKVQAGHATSMENENRLGEKRNANNVSNIVESARDSPEKIQDRDRSPSSEESYEESTVEAALPAMVTLSRSHAHGGCDVLSIVPLEQASLVNNAESVNSPLCTNMIQTVSKKHQHLPAMSEEDMNGEVSENTSQEDLNNTDLYIQQSARCIPGTQQVLTIDDKNVEKIHRNVGHEENHREISLGSEAGSQIQTLVRRNSDASSVQNGNGVEEKCNTENRMRLFRSQSSLNARPYTSSGIASREDDLDIQPHSRPFTSSSSSRKQTSRKKKRMQAIANSIETMHERDRSRCVDDVRDGQEKDGLREHTELHPPTQQTHHKHRYPEFENESYESAECHQPHDHADSQQQQQQQHGRSQISRGTSTKSARKRVYIDYTHCQPYMLLRQPQPQQQSHHQHDQCPDPSQRDPNNDNTSEQRRREKRVNRRREAESYSVMNEKIQEWLNNPE